MVPDLRSWTLEMLTLQMGVDPTFLLGEKIGISQTNQGIDMMITGHTHHQDLPVTQSFRIFRHWEGVFFSQQIACSYWNANVGDRGDSN